MKALIIGTRIAIQDSYSGANRRIMDISNFLKGAGYSVELAENKVNKKNYDLICLVSYANAKHLVWARRKCQILWFDSTDSWSLTHSSLRFGRSPKGWMRIFRDKIYLKKARVADILTFCSERDADFHRNLHPQSLVFSHIQPPWKKLPDFGRRLVFVGPMQYLPNATAVKWLENFYSEHPELSLRLFIYGHGYKSGNDDRIQYIPNATDSEIYGSRDIHLAPIELGAGVKYKVVYPVALGITTATTSEAANGLLRDSPHLFVEKSLEKLGTRILLLAKENINQVDRVGYILENDDKNLILQLLDSGRLIEE